MQGQIASCADMAFILTGCVNVVISFHFTAFLFRLQFMLFYGNTRRDCMRQKVGKISKQIGTLANVGYSFEIIPHNKDLIYCHF